MLKTINQVALLTVQKIDQIDLKFNSCGATTNNNDRSLAVYAVNYNILRIMSGMGGLAYTN